jgi:hypothetical protein
MKDIPEDGRKKTSVSVNLELLERVSRLLHTKSVKDTIEQALLEVLKSRARTEEVAALRSMTGMDLNRPQVMKKAWRR